MAVEITESKIGYLHFLNDDQVSLDLFSWSEGAKNNCTAVKDEHYPLEKAGIWADSARTGQPVIHNDYPLYPDKKGLPDGHAPLFRHLSVPVSDNSKIVLIAVSEIKRNLTVMKIPVICFFFLMNYGS